ncbi:MAG: SRPBCC family protein [Synechococcales bacterium]|nr:SRPBCC family protein [Synechococcales bacterium]
MTVFLRIPTATLGATLFSATAIGGLMVHHLVAHSQPAQASQLFNSPVDRLPATQRAELRNGQTVVTGDRGNYVARVLVTTSPDVAWSVLTDYRSFARFLPNVVSSRVVEDRGNQKIVEQVDARQVFLVNVRSRVRSAIVETNRQRIDFRQIDGDLQQLSGYWKIEPIAPFAGAKPNQVLITQVVAAQPKSGTPRDVFYDIFKDSLDDTMQAIRREVGRRSR